MNPGAFFDLDGTLLRCESQALLLRYLRHHGHAPLKILLPIALGMAAFKAGLMKNPEPLRRRAVRMFANWSGEEAAALLNDFFMHEISGSFDVEVVRRLRFHRKQGDRVFILSAAVEPLVRLAGDHLDVRLIAGTRLAMVDRVCTGLIEGKAPWGIEKANRLRELCAEHAIDPRRSWAYADHRSDIAFLSAVGHPVAVNPEGLLLKTARLRGWEVLRTR